MMRIMEGVKMKDAVLVMTARGPDRILQESGSQAWVLNPKNAGKHKYLVTIQNRHNGAWGGATEPHGNAFLVGKISEVVLSPEPRRETDPLRYLIKISEYARINVPSKWRGSNPVRYVNIQEEFGIDPESLEFKPMPTPVDVPQDKPEDAAHEDYVEADDELVLTIAQAKIGLAANYGVREDQIKIIIEG
jgi:hypothetical protein